MMRVKCRLHANGQIFLMCLTGHIPRAFYHFERAVTVKEARRRNYSIESGTIILVKRNF